MTRPRTLGAGDAITVTVAMSDQTVRALVGGNFKLSLAEVGFGFLLAVIDDMGPLTANSQGALSDLLKTGAQNLQGNGRAFNDSVRNFAQLARTLAGSEVPK